MVFNSYVLVNKLEKMNNMPTNYNLDLVSYPSEYGGKIVKLANEMIFANFDLELVEQRLLYYTMSVFDFEPFLSDSEVHRVLTGKGQHNMDLSLITSSLINRYFWSPELRAIRIPLSDLMRNASGSGKNGKGNWKWFDSIISDLSSKQIYIRERIESSGQKITHERIPIFGKTYYLEGGEQKEVVITFAQEFLPYLIAFHSYKKIDIAALSKLESKYSPRFLNFFVYSVNEQGKGAFTISVDKIRERLEIKPEQFKRGLYEKVVKRAVDEINEKIPYINMKTEVVRNEKARGRPTTGYKFKVNISSINAIKDLSNVDKSKMPEPKSPLPLNYKDYQIGEYDPDMPF